MELLEAPALGDELAGEPVEEIGMGGACAVASEVVGRVRDAGPEVVLPDAVDDDAGGEGVGGAGQPAFDAAHGLG